MRKKNLLFVLLLVIAVSITFIACELISSEDIVGTWTDLTGSEEWIFNADNSFTNNWFGFTFTGTWSLTKDLLTLDYNEDIETDQYDIRISDGSMYWELQDTGITWKVFDKE